MSNKKSRAERKRQQQPNRIPEDQKVVHDSVRPQDGDEQRVADEGRDVAVAKAEGMIAEIEGAAKFGSEYLQASTFARRFNQLALNVHRAHNFEASVVSEDPREVNVFFNFEVVATWKPTVAEGSDLTQVQSGKWDHGRKLEEDGSPHEPAPAEQQPVADRGLPAMEASSGGVVEPKAENLVPPAPSAVVNPADEAAAQAVADEEKRKANEAAGIVVIDPAANLPVNPKPREVAESATQKPDPVAGDAVAIDPAKRADPAAATDASAKPAAAPAAAAKPTAEPAKPAVADPAKPATPAAAAATDPAAKAE